jgi:hypothetical protein
MLKSCTMKVSVISLYGIISLYFIYFGTIKEHAGLGFCVLEQMQSFYQY